jgi:hypothetical protein
METINLFLSPLLPIALLAAQKKAAIAALKDVEERGYTNSSLADLL